MRPSKRRLIQVYAALLYNAHIKGFINGEIFTGNSKYACVPGFNCYSCPGAVGSCPLGALQNALAYSGKTAGFYVFGILLLYGIIFGRTICGFLCPLGLIQELLHKIPTPKIPKGRVTRALSYLKYIITAVFVFGITLWYGIMHGTTIPGFCKYICPAGTSEGAMMLLANPNNADDFGMLNILFTRKFVIMLIIGVACIFCFRAFCRFICPLGAIYGLFNRFNIIGVKVDKNRCNGCGACVRNCQMDVRRVGDHECINCGKCMEVCAQKAISIKAGSITLKAPEGGCAGDKPGAEKKRKIIAGTLWGIALAGLAFALVWFNFLDPSLKKPEPPVQPAQPAVTQEQPQAAEEVVIPVGFEEGNRLADFEIECLGGEKFSVSAAKGKPVVINLWATYCGPCVQELPLFNELYEAHRDDIAMVAVHNCILDDDPAEWVANSGYTMPFAVDTEDKTVWNAVGGTSSMPQTIVLDRNGIVIYNKRKSVDKALLESLYAEAAASEYKPEAAEETVSAPEVSAPVGFEEGSRLADFTIDCLNGEAFSVSAAKGKPVVINLWATYCGPCVQELPLFNELYEAHRDDIAMVAVHNCILDDDPAEWVANSGYTMPFAVDTEDKTVWNAVGGTSSMPQTIVLDRNGIVIYNKRKSVDKALLESLYAEAAEK